MNDLARILAASEHTKEDLLCLLETTDKEKCEQIFRAAYETKVKNVGNTVYFRGIIEFSNVCIKDCLYCGIRKSNSDVQRFRMKMDEIVASGQWAYDNKYGSVVLQSGERVDEEFVSFVEQAILALKKIGDGSLGITLSLGEQTRETYERWYKAGAHRYLLRIETSNPELYQKLHPADHSFAARVQCLKELRALGYQVGTGVMIGLPGQTTEDLVNDLLFFRDMNIDMIGMGPYVVHKDTPLGPQAANSKDDQARRFELGLKMIAACRLLLKDVNIASTTALQALNPVGRELGLKAGANIIMPIITDVEYRRMYQLYDGKPCLDDKPDHCKNCLENRIRSVGDHVGYGNWGDSPHFKKKGS